MYYSDSGSASHRPIILICVTLFLAVAAEFIPWPGFILPFQPNFPLLALVYWVIHQPKLVNYAVALAIGVILDLADQAPIGFNALSNVMVVFATNILGNRFILLTIFSQALHVLALLVLGQLCLYVLGSFLESQATQPTLSWFLFMPSLSSASLWLLLPIGIRYLHNFFFGRARHDAAY